jgi:hypothetical protein
MYDILQLLARFTTPVLTGQILSSMMDFNEDKLTNEDCNNTETDMNSASGFAYLLILTGKAATAFQTWGRFKSTTIMLECLTKRLRYPKIEKIDTTKPFPFECIQFGKIAYKQSNHKTWKLAKKMAAEMERFTVEITLCMKARFFMKVVRSKCIVEAEVYQHRGEAVERTADVSDIVKGSPAGENKEIIEFNKRRQKLYIKCGDRLKETRKRY